jgi:hypothetical protein
LDLPLSEARTLRDLSTLVRRRGDAAGADRLAEEARAIFRQYGAREYAELSDGAEPPDGAEPSGNAE